ncbi:MAG: hypothetical protein ACM3YE_08085, partial [Bacteroidota bacterium]
TKLASRKIWTKGVKLMFADDVINNEENVVESETVEESEAEEVLESEEAEAEEAEEAQSEPAEQE